MFKLNSVIVAGKFFLIITGELVLIFVAVSFLIGLLTEYLPPSRIRDFLSNKLTGVQYLLGAGLGALTPFCSCSTIPITAGLLRGGVPFGPIMAFLFSSPVLNPVIIALLLSLLGVKITVFYVVVTFFGAMTAAALLAKFGMESEVKPLMNIQNACCMDDKTKSDLFPVLIQETPVDCCPSEKMPSPALTIFPSFQDSGSCCGGEREMTAPQSLQTSCCAVNFEEDGSIRVPFKKKIKNAGVSAVETFKGVFWYLLLGAGIGAFIYGFFPQDLVVRLAGPGNPWSIPIASLIGVPMYIRAETVIPISAALVGKGMGVGTVLALIIGGAGSSIPEMIILGSMFKKKLIVAFVLNVFLVAIVAGYLVEFLLY
ncbi:MAG TPA: permease [Syntrophales bacterium]|mgnify:CR=1 FL=1|nr:permease [Syntrophales bacterium]HPQ44993.1 permease [Syntrophales bacterium]